MPSISVSIPCTGLLSVSVTKLLYFAPDTAGCAVVVVPGLVQVS
jgi:hypothetical protein